MAHAVSQEIEELERRQRPDPEKATSIDDGWWDAVLSDPPPPAGPGFRSGLGA